LNLSAIWRNGLNNIAINIVKINLQSGKIITIQNLDSTVKDNKTKGQRGDNIGNWKENGVIKLF
jgi:hypothetical protein